MFLMRKKKRVCMCKEIQGLRKCYEKLYDIMSENEQFGRGFVDRDLEVRLNKNVLGKLTSFTAMEGKKYRNNEVKLMIIGRAVNGWGEYLEKTGNEVSRKDFVESSIKNICNNEWARANKEPGNDRFEWIDWHKGTFRNVYRKGIDKCTEEEFYRITEDDKGNKWLPARSPFWNYSKKIWERLVNGKNAEETKWEDRWFENIVWSNLYKVSPADEGNPTDELQSVQRSACADLLLKEIEYFKPTHILFYTDSEWFKCFFELSNQIISEIEYKGTNIVRGEKNNEVYVERAGILEHKNGKTKCIVSCRPEGRNKDNYVNDICSKFEKM